MNDVKERAQPIHGMQFPRERAGQVETKTIHVHFLHPVPQTVHDQLQDVWAQHIQCVSAARVVHVKPTGFRRQSVVGGIIDAAQRKRGAQMVSFTGVVVDHIQNHFQTRAMQSANHLFEFAHRTADRCCSVTRIGRKKRQGVVTPVV